MVDVALEMLVLDILRELGLLLERYDKRHEVFLSLGTLVDISFAMHDLITNEMGDICGEQVFVHDGGYGHVVLAARLAELR